MEDWLLQKKLSEAHKIAQLMDMQEREAKDQHLRERASVRSYRAWLKKNMAREQQ